MADLLEALEIETGPSPRAAVVGSVMRAWYDVAARGGDPEDEAGLRASLDQVEALIAREAARGLPARSLVLAGFSQGGALALLAGLRHPARLAGILALSCYLPLAHTLAAEAAPANRAVPILMAHGTHDDVIPIARARDSRDRLVAAGYAVEWREYRMPHSVCDQEVLDIGT
ncbi:MAG: carboxylesterase [Candidatus Rokubacteria bacterium]|nr:carboxylesterase [Candidatus Rokubacteria bacterium]